MNYQNNEIGYIGFIHLISRLKGKKGSETMPIKSFHELLVIEATHVKIKYKHKISNKCRR